MGEAQQEERGSLERMLKRAARWLPEQTLEQPAAEAVCVAVLCPILLWIAWWNGFPFVFYDTGAYALEGFRHVFLPERSPVYSLFLAYAGAQESFWYIVIIQALMTAFTMTEFARAEAPRMPSMLLLGIGVMLTLVTAIAWPVGQVEPDCMTAIAVLAIYLLSFHTRTLGWVRGVALLAICAFAIACHPSHLGLAGGLLIALAVMRLASWYFREEHQIPRPVLLAPSACFALAIGLVLAANDELTGKMFISRSGPVFIFARLLQDGIVKRLLDDTCPGSHYVLCHYKDQLPERADAWLWRKGTLFYKLGGFVGTRVESERIVNDSLVRYPLMQVETALVDTALQFFLVRTGDGFESEEPLLAKHFRGMIPTQMKAYLNARQQRGGIGFFPLLNVVHVTVALFTLIALIYMISTAMAARDWKGLTLPAFLMLALLGNAFVCGALSGPHDRYQSRLVWVPVFVLAVTTRPWAVVALRRPVESVT